MEQAGFLVAQAGGVHEALEVYQGRKCDAVIADLSLKDESGFVLIQRLMRRDEQVKIMVLTVHCLEEYVLKAIQAGAWGYVTKGDSAEEMLFALRTVLKGRFYLSSSMLHILVKRMLLTDFPLRKSSSWRETLSEREQEVLELAARGLKNWEIARKLGLHIKTVEKHRHNGMRKLGVEDRPRMRAMLQVIKADLAADMVI